MLNQSKHFKKAALAVVISSILGGCNSSSSGGGDTAKNPGNGNESEQRVSLTGLAVKGLLSNATVTAYSLDKSVNLQTTETSSDGSYTLADMDFDGAILVELTTNAKTTSVCDAANGCGDKVFGAVYPFNDANFKLTSVLPSASTATNQKLMVTPLTHLAAQQVISSGVTEPADIQGTVNATAELLGLDGVDINTLAPVDITDPAAVQAASSDAQLYGALVGAIATLAEERADTSIADVLETLVEDYEDGGLVGNSTDESKITLDVIFETAGDVVEAAEVKAEAEDVELNLDATSTALVVEQQEAQSEEADTDIEPEVVPDEPVDPTSDAAKLASLLEDVSTWDQALELASDKGIYQPFEDQLIAAKDLVNVVGEQSKLLKTAEKLIIGNEYEVYGCWDGQESSTLISEAECTAGGFDGAYETESDDSALMTGSYVFAASVEFAAFFERHYRLLGTVPESATLTLEDAISLNFDGMFAPDADDDGDLNTVILTPVFSNAGRMLSASVTFTHNNPNSDEAVQFSLNVARDEGSSDASTITYQVSDITGYIDNDIGTANDEYFSGDGGSITFKFANAAAAQYFIGETDTGDYQSMVDLVGIDTELDVEVSIGSIDGTVVAEKAGFNISSSFEKAQGASALSSADLSIGINVENVAENEALNGTITFDLAGDLLETINASDPTELMHEYIASAIEVKFEGDITARSDDNSVATFDGAVIASGTFIPVSIDPENEAEELSISFDGDFSVTDSAGLETTFVGDINATLETLKNADGSPYILDGEMRSEPSQAGFVGTLTTETATGSASVSLNAALAVDYSSMVFPAIDYPSNGDIATTVTYSLKDGVEAALVAGQTPQLSSITLTADVESGVNAMVKGLNTQLPGMRAEIGYRDAQNTELTISLADCAEDDLFSDALQCDLLINNAVVNHLDSLNSDNTLIGILNSFQFQQHGENARLFAPTFILWTDFGDIWMSRAEYMEVPFEAPGASGTYSVNQNLVVHESDFNMEIDAFATEANYPVYSAALQIDTELVGIDDGQIKVSATNTGHDSFTGSALFSYGNRNIKLDADTDSLVGKDQTFITLSNGEISLKLVAECATATNDEGVHDIDAIAACEGDLNFSGDVYIDGADEKVAVVEDRGGLPVIKFVSGDSYGVVLTPNFDFVKQ
jgi:hypothetical protein